MAKAKQGVYGNLIWQPAPPKMTRQGKSQYSKLSATSRNGRRKKYRGQGR